MSGMSLSQLSRRRLTKALCISFKASLVTGRRHLGGVTVHHLDEATSRPFKRSQEPYPRSIIVAQGPNLWLRGYMVAVDVGPEACSR